MKNKFPIILLVIVIGIAVLAIMTTSVENTSNNTLGDFTPEEEINNTSLRETVVTLYFVDKDGNNIKSEGKLIDSSELLENPYKTIVQFLIDGPKGDSLNTVFPENTKILNANLEKNCVILNFSEDLLNYADDTQKYNIINSLLNSLTQLNEVNSIKIQVNNENTEQFSEEYFRINK